MNQTPDPPDRDYEALAREAEMGYEWRDDGGVDSVAMLLTDTTDASVWAATFKGQFHDVAPDEYTMLAWFANALETGRTQGRKELCPHNFGRLADDLWACTDCGTLTSTAGVPSPWRHPDEETEGYPNLIVDDGRVTGQITIGHSRLPVSAILATAIGEDWDSVEDGWSPTEHYGFTEDDLCRFLYDLLDQRGEFARLLLALANVSRLDDERDHAALEPYADDDGVAVVQVWPPGPDTVDMPDPWWEVPELRGPVVDALTRCLAALHDGRR